VRGSKEREKYKEQERERRREKYKEQERERRRGGGVSE